MEKFVNGTAGGTHVAGAPLTTSAAMEASPALLRTAIDARITKVRPMSTPIDQISRMAGSKHADSMDVAYYSVDTKPDTTTVAEECILEAFNMQSDTGKVITLKVNEVSIFEKSDTVLLPGHYNKSKTHTLVGYISDISANQLTVALFEDSDETIAKGDTIVRMGRAATELDVQTAQFQALPVRKNNFCQIFKMQVEQSTMMRLADKEVGWNFSEQEEAAVFDMRLGMEKNFLVGCKARIFDKTKNEYVYFTDGIWRQAGDDISFDLSDDTGVSFIELAQKVFTGNNGSRKRLLIGGSEFVAALSRMHAKNKLELGATRTKWGLETREIITNFGSLYVIFSEVFDQCNHSGDAMVLDQSFITKYTHIPFHPEKLDLRASGTRNTDAVVLTEASCLVLRNPSAHFRIIGM